MSSLADVNLIRVFGIYLIVMFIVSMARRFVLYRGVARLALAGRSRWPRVFEVMNENRLLFLSWAVFRSALFALVITVVYVLCSRVLYPNAQVTPRALAGVPWLAVLLCIPLAVMLAIDSYGLIVKQELDEAGTIAHLDKAEKWADGPRRKIVKWATLGRFDTREMVINEVRKAIVAGREALNQTFWWVVIQMGARVAFGLCLWASFVFHPKIH